VCAFFFSNYANIKVPIYKYLYVVKQVVAMFKKVYYQQQLLYII